MKKFTLLIILLLLLSACTNGDRYNFLGSNKNWEVSYVVEVANGNKESTTGTIKYIGEGPAPESIDYQIDANSGGSKSTGVSVKDGVANLGNDSCEGCAVIQEDEEITVEITWDEQTEKLILTNKK